MSKFEIISLDVWGNESDGFQVNQAFNTGKFIEFADDSDDGVIVDALKAGGFLVDTVMVDDVTIEGEIDFQLYIEHAETGEPLWHLYPATE